MPHLKPYENGVLLAGLGVGCDYENTVLVPFLLSTGTGTYAVLKIAVESMVI